MKICMLRDFWDTPVYIKPTVRCFACILYLQTVVVFQLLKQQHAQASAILIPSLTCLRHVAEPSKPGIQVTFLMA